jgi:hypothetical protein
MAVDVDSLPPTEYLVMDVLAARARLGETYWTFPSRLRPAMRSLADRGLLWWQPGNVPHTIQAFLTGEGRAAVLYEGYTDPVAAERKRLTAQFAEQIRIAELMASSGERQQAIRKVFAPLLSEGEGDGA